MVLWTALLLFARLSEVSYACVTSECTVTEDWQASNVCLLSGKTLHNLMCPWDGELSYIESTAKCAAMNEGEGVLHAGSCECPNDCGRGSCQKDRCQCDAGYGGPDCLAITCPNSCSGHGTCSTLDEVDYCHCKAGWTGFDCSRVSPSLPHIPQIFPMKPYLNDKYGDDHSVFQLDLIG